MRALAETLFPIVVQGRDAAHTLAATFYAEQRAEYVRGQYRRVSAPHYELDGLADELRRTTATANATADVGAMIVRHVEQAGRETITQQARADPKAVASARVASGRETCAFCTMLIGRGPVYSTASGDFPAHDRCDCIAVPVFNRRSYAGRDQYEAAYELWKNNAAGASDPLNALRRKLYADQRDARRDDTADEPAA